MENYSYNSSYPDSGDSSPRSREIDFDPIQAQNSMPWPDDHNYKPKFLCSYGGKIHPRPHDNQLSYIGGDTKILSVDRSIRFSSFLSKLSSLCASPEHDTSTLTFKYQLPGEDLDALISVTNDDDLEHMMHEYDRLFRSSPKPARMRLFLFNNNNSNNNSVANTNSNNHSSYGSDGAKSDRDRFVDALNSDPVVPEMPPPSVTSPPPPPPAAMQNNVDFLLGLEKGVPVPHQNIASPPPPPVAQAAAPPQVVRVPGFPPEFQEDRIVGSDLPGIHAQLQRLQVREQLEQQQHVRVPGLPAGKNTDDNLIGGYAVGGGGGGEYYVQRPATSVPVSVAAAYWSEKQVAGGGPGGGGLHAQMAVTPDQQPVYMIPGPGGMYHASPVMRPVTGQAGQGYYMQRVGGVAGAGGPHEVYREQPVYGVVPQPQPVIPTSTQQPQQLPSHPTAAVGPTATTSGGYAQLAYDSALGRQVYYNAPAAQQPTPTPQTGGVAYQGVEGKVVVSKASQGSV